LPESSKELRDQTYKKWKDVLGWVKGANTSRDKENVFIGFWPFQDSFLSGTLELPDFVDRATFGGSKRSNLLPWDRPSFRYKRFGSKVLQESHPCGPVLTFTGIVIFLTF